MPDAEKDAAVGYVRDRTFYQSRPRCSHTPKVHRESVAHPGMAACDGRFILLDTDHPIALDGQPHCLRCFPLGVTTPGVSNA